jgi:DNA-binding MarR family transcriptional regulator
VAEVVSRAGSASQSTGFMLWRATMTWQREVRAALEPHGLTHAQFVLLASAWWLASIGEEVTQRRLGAHAGVDEMTTSQVVRRLEVAGLVRRAASERDARARLVAVTDAGRDALAPAMRDVEAVDAACFGALGHREEGFRAALHVLVGP